VCRYSWDSEEFRIALPLQTKSGGEQIQFSLFGKEADSFIEKELLSNAYLIDYNTIKYVFGGEQ